MNILPDFQKLQNFCEQRWENIECTYFHCHNTGHACNEHVCPLLDHFCAECGDSEKLSEIVITFKRDCIKELLEQCTEKQKELFNRLYPMGLNSLPENKMDTAYDQCRRTVLKNNKNGMKE